MAARFEFKITETLKRNRLDIFLSEQITTVSKIHLRNLIDRGECFVNGERCLPGYHLKAEDVVNLDVDTTALTSMTPEEIPLEVVYEDAEIVVVDKPAGLLVHPTLGQKSGTLLNALAFYLNRGNISEKLIRPGLIHRLDRQTSGLLVVAKTGRALSFLSRHFQKKLVNKNYFAIVGGIVAADSGIIDAPIGISDDGKSWSVTADGKSAVSNFQVLKRMTDRTLLDLEPVTGRTNQLRIHCAFLGHAIIGDSKYGGRKFGRLCLHARKLNFYHPVTNTRMEFVSSMPAEFEELLAL